MNLVNVNNKKRSFVIQESTEVETNKQDKTYHSYVSVEENERANRQAGRTGPDRK